jgi:hypothetical protein
MAIDQERVTLDTIINNLQNSRSHMKFTPWPLSTGYFAGVVSRFSPEVHQNPQRLFGLELLVSQLIEGALRRKDKVNVLGLGEMLGISLVKLAVRHRSAVLSGALNIFATTYEKDFDVREALNESQRRLDIFGHTNSKQNAELYIAHCLKEENKDAAELLRANKPILDSQIELDFLRRNHVLVRYLKGVDTVDLKDHLKSYLEPGEKIDIMHEHFGGLMHYPPSQIHNLLPSFPSILDTHKGILITSTDIEHSIYADGFNRLRVSGFRRLANSERPNGMYHIRAFGGIGSELPNFDLTQSE